MLGATLESECWGSLCWVFGSGPETVPIMSAYGPDYLFRAAMGVSGGSRFAKDLQGGPRTMASGNGPKQD